MLTDCDDIFMEQVILGFSGGVDSAVSALLLKKQGFSVAGVYLDIGSGEEAESVKKAAAAMEVPLTVVPVRELLEAQVCRPFTEAYLAGRTPNPCILCNPAVKFAVLLSQADKAGARYIATGHYARRENDRILKGHPANDQSYMLCRLKKEQAERLLLPLGPYPKAEVRAMAAEANLPAAHKKDSMEICFIPDKNYAAYLASRAALPGPGPLIFHGEAIGEHEGLIRYTVGQRYPGLLDGRKVYVSALSAESNTVTLSLWEELFTTTVYAEAPTFLFDTPEFPFRASVRVRHTKWEEPPCTVYSESGRLRIECDTPVRAPAPGQSAVLYSGDVLLGGGFITRSL